MSNMDSVMNALDNTYLPMYRSAVGIAGEGNMIMSPLSILYATLLVYLGSAGETKREYDKMYGFNPNASVESNVKPFGQGMELLKLSPQNATMFSGIGSSRNRMITLKMANGMFLEDEFEISKDYLTQTKALLKSEVERKDFRRNGEKAAMEINRWVEVATGGKIRNLVSRQSASRNTKALLVNALYFNAAWKTSFPIEDTIDDDFYLLNDQQKKVPMMHLKESFNYAKDPVTGAEFLELPYKTGAASLLILLPKEKKGLRLLEEQMSNDIFARLSRAAARRKVVLDMPRFKVESTLDAKNLLQQIGLKNMFTDKANLTQMVAKGEIQISKVLHKAFIDLDEKGTEAAAATSIEVVFMSAFPSLNEEEVVRVKVDHPFIFAIRHNPTRLILFTGRVENP